MVRFNDKPQIENSQISEDDILPITDMDSSENDKKITLGQIKDFVNDGKEKADSDLVNTQMVTDGIISAPNGVFETSNNNQAITVKNGLKMVFANGRADETGRYAVIEHTTEQDITQSIITLSDGTYELFLTNNDTILFIPITSVYISEEEPTLEEDNAYWYSLIENYWKSTTNSGESWSTATIGSLGNITIVENLITDIYTNQPVGIVSFEVLKALSSNDTVDINNPTTLLDFKWSDHALNNLSWLNADTFSWQSGDVYTSVYEHLLSDIEEVESETETIGSHEITFYSAEDGHKIVLANQEQTVANIYTATGVAWYYILDTTNRQFKLPRTKYNFNGLRDKVGKFIPESLPNITGTIGGQRIPYASPGGAIYWENVGSAYYSNPVASVGDYRISFNASLSSPTYQDGAPVQERATQMYLYFYVGETVQNAKLIDAGRIAEQLDGKADIDLSNCENTNSKAIDGQVVYYYSILSNATTIGSYTLSLANILPNDGYAYMVYGFMTAHRDDTSGVDTQLQLNDGAGQLTCFCEVDGAHNQRNNSTWEAYVPANNRNLYLYVFSYNLTSSSVTMIRYRRLGKNI